MEEVQTPKKDAGDIYLEASVLAQSTEPADLAEAYRLFTLVPDYLDARERAAALKPLRDKYIDEQKELQLKALQKAGRRKKLIKKLVIFGVILAVLVTGAVLLTGKIRSDYARAVELMEQGEYRKADKIMRFLFGYGDSKELRQKAREKLDAFDSVKQELLSGEVSQDRMNELHASLVLMREFSEARELLPRFSRRLTGYTRTPATGTYTIYECSYDEAGNMVTLTAGAHTADGEFQTTYTKYITGSAQDSQMVSEWDYGSKKLSDSTVVKETVFYEGGYETEMETDYHDDPTRYIYYRWYDAEDKLLYGVSEDSSIAKSTSKKTVELHTRKLDENGRLARSWQQEVTKKGKLEDKEKETVYSYDEKGNLTQEIHYKTTEKKGKVDYKVTYTYDDQGRVTQMVDDGDTTVYSYNAFGELEKAVLTKDKKVTETAYRYGYFFNKDGLE